MICNKAYMGDRWKIDTPRCIRCEKSPNGLKSILIPSEGWRGGRKSPPFDSAASGGSIKPISNNW